MAEGRWLQLTEVGIFCDTCKPRDLSQWTLNPQLTDSTGPTIGQLQPSASRIMTDDREQRPSPQSSANKINALRESPKRRQFIAFSWLYQNYRLNSSSSIRKVPQRFLCLIRAFESLHARTPLPTCGEYFTVLGYAAWFRAAVVGRSFLWSWIYWQSKLFIRHMRELQT